MAKAALRPNNVARVEIQLLYIFLLEIIEYIYSYRILFITINRVNVVYLILYLIRILDYIYSFKSDSVCIALEYRINSFLLFDILNLESYTSSIVYSLLISNISLIDYLTRSLRSYISPTLYISIEIFYLVYTPYAARSIMLFYYILKYSLFLRY